MLMKHETINQTKGYSICWRAEWIHQFESPLSVIEKVKMANCISRSTFMRAFGGSNKRVQPSPINSLKKRDLYSLRGLNEDTLMSILSFDSASYHKFIDSVCSASVLFKQVKNNFSDKLNYCEDCVKYNFHSIVHQLRFINICPFVSVKSSPPSFLILAMR